MNRMRSIFVSIPISVLLLSTAAHAEWQKVDLGRAGTNYPGSGFTNWPLTVTSYTSGTATFGSYTCTVTQVAPTPSSTNYLEASWYNKTGIGAFQMAFDGAFVRWKDDTSSPKADLPYPDGGSLTLTISGLTTGTHNIVTYHNDPWPATMTWSVPNGSGGTRTVTNVPSKYQIYVSGESEPNSLVRKVVTPSVCVNNDDLCAYAFFQVNAVAGTNIVITFTPDGTGTMNTVFLNAFEIDAPSEPSAMARVPVPADGDTHVNAGNDDPAPGEASNGSVALSWTASTLAVSHNVYFGTSQTAVFNATTTTPTIYKGNQTATTYTATGLTSALTYYWRIDEVRSAATGIITKGVVWSFKPRRQAYPGAVGYGRFSHSGRGGQVIEVTNLNDSGEGSLRDALVNHTGPRVVVFRVGGVIALQSKILMDGNHGDVYIAGQTAPGSGIAVTQYNIGPYGAKDATIRYIRLRVGDYAAESIDGIGQSSCDHTIIDHCSISWCLDVGTNSLAALNNTFSNNIISEGLNNSYHYNGGDRTTTERHSFAASIGGHNATYYKNLLAHNTGRNFSLAGGLEQDALHYGGYVDVRNNVIYNWQGRTNDGGCRAVNLVNNYYKGGPVTELLWLLKLDGNELSLAQCQQAYVSGNKMTNSSGSMVIDPSGDNWSYCSAVKNATIAQIKSTTPLIGSENVVTLSADDAYTNVLASAGATLPRRDAIDTRIVREVANRTYTYIGSKDGLHGIIDSQDDVTADGYSGYALVNHIMDPGAAPTDSDHDGMPDWWETMKGLNPNNYADTNYDLNNDGYTNLEEYLAWLDAGGRPCGYGDLDNNCQVDFRDFALLGAAWAGTGSADVDVNGTLNYLDMAKFAENWLTCNNSVSANCWQ